MPLFDEKVRVDPKPSSGHESTFEFLDRVSTPYFGEVRHALNRWGDDYPGQERDELFGRLRDTSGSFRDAFWELWLYTAYRGAGFEVEIHPKITDSTKRPDLAVSRGNFAAYLEARVVTGTSARLAARENLLDGLVEAFNRGDHPDFRLSLSVTRHGTGQPSARMLRTRVVKWLDSLNVEAVAAQGPPLPQHVEIDRDWEFRFSALPIKREKRGRSNTPLIAVTPGGSFVGDATTAFRRGLSQKGSRYGAAADPLIVAIQTEEPWIHDEDIESTLYGRTSQMAERSGSGLVPGAVQRLEDGYWTSANGRRVAAVLTAEKVRPWSVLHSRPRLWMEPFRGVGLVHPPIWRRGTLQQDRLAVRWTDPTENEMDRWFGVTRDWPIGTPFPMTS